MVLTFQRLVVLRQEEFFLAQSNKFLCFSHIQNVAIFFKALSHEDSIVTEMVSENVKCICTIHIFKLHMMT